MRRNLYNKNVLPEFIKKGGKVFDLQKKVVKNWK